MPYFQPSQWRIYVIHYFSQQVKSEYQTRSMPPKKILEYELQQLRGASFVSFIYSYLAPTGETIRVEYQHNRYKQSGSVNIYRAETRVASASENRREARRRIYIDDAFEATGHDSGFPFMREIDPVYERAMSVLRCIDTDNDAQIDAMLYSLHKGLHNR